MEEEAAEVAWAGNAGVGEGITLSKNMWTQQKTFGSNSALPHLKR